MKRKDWIKKETIRHLYIGKYLICKKDFPMNQAIPENIMDSTNIFEGEVVQLNKEIYAIENELADFCIFKRMPSGSVMNMGTLNPEEIFERFDELPKDYQADF